MIMVLSQWVPLFFICTWMYGIRAMQEQLPRGVADVAAFYKTRPVFCPSGQPSNGCSILLHAKLVWVLFWAVAKEYLARGAKTARPNKKNKRYTKHQEAKRNSRCKSTYLGSVKKKSRNTFRPQQVQEKIKTGYAGSASNNGVVVSRSNIPVCRNMITCLATEADINMLR